MNLPISAAGFFDISNIPLLASLIIISIFLLFIGIIALGKTKAATAETRVGQVSLILLPSGKKVDGLMTLAKGLVSEAFLFELARTQTIADDKAKKLQEKFKDLFFYAIRAGRKYLVVSTQNLESPDYAIVLKEVFEFPFGYIAKRFAMGEATESERSGWRVITIAPRKLSVQDAFNPEVFRNMTDIGDAAAVLKDLAIRAKKELPYKEIAKAREKQLEETQDLFAKSEHEKGVLRMAAGKTNLLEHEGGEEPTAQRSPVETGYSLWRVAASIITFLITFYFLPQYYPQVGDPLIPSLVAFGAMLFFVYPQIQRLVGRWL